MKTFDYSAPGLDSRSLIERLEELTAERDDILDRKSEAEQRLREAEYDLNQLLEPTEGTTEEERREAEIRCRAADLEEQKVRAEWESWDAESGDEWKALCEIDETGRASCPDWRYGVCLIREDYFAEHMRADLVETDCLPKNLPGWFVVDWDATAENLKADYTEIEVMGATYLAR